MDFIDYLGLNAKKIETELDKILLEFLKEVKKTSPKLVFLVKEFINSCQGGKRIRGVLAKLGFEIAGVNQDKEIYKVGAALEIMHAAILVHDDIIDKSPLRRGKPSLYKVLGKDLAMTLGDLGFFLAIKIISESNFPEKDKNNALNLFSETMLKTAFGQIMDIQKDDPVITARLKTALYTISGPLRLGAILGGATSKLDKLGEFGNNLGIAYQIRDDILDGEAGDQARKQLREYTAKADKIIPDITKDQRLGKIMKQMCEYLVERSR